MKKLYTLDKVKNIFKEKLKGKVIQTPSFREIEKAANQKIEAIIEAKCVTKEDKIELKSYIDNLLLKIKLLQSDINDRNRFNEIKQAFELAIKIEEKGYLKRKIPYKYARYLYESGLYAHAIKVLDSYIEYLDKEKIKINAHVYDIMGLCYFAIDNYDQAKIYFKLEEQILENLVDERFELYRLGLSSCYTNFGTLYLYTKDYEQAEKYYIKDAKFCEKLIKKMPWAYYENLFAAYRRLGKLYINMKNYSEAEKYLTRVADLNKKQADKDPVRYNHNLAIAYEDLGNLYAYKGRYDTVEMYYLKSLQIKEKISEYQIYNSELSTAYDKLGNFYVYIKKYKEAEKNYLKAIELRKQLASNNKTMFLPKLITVCRNLTMLYHLTEDYDKEKECINQIKKYQEEIIGEKNESQCA